MMKNAVLKFLWIYILFVVVFVLMKPVFLAVYASVIGASASDWVAVIYHGFSMDLCVAGYLTVLPGLLIAGELMSKACWLRGALTVYMSVAAVAVAVICCLDLGLYGSWGFRLDMTPVFYITTSPTAAMASVQWWHWLAGATGMGLICGGMWFFYHKTAGRIAVTPSKGWRRLPESLAMLAVTGLLFIPIRGSVTVSTMNLSRAYFSTNPRLNHAAINPAFSLLYSATHQGDFSEEYDFMPDDEAEKLVGELLYTSAGRAEADTAARKMLSTDRPDIVIVILESFSAHLMPSLGGENIAVGLDSLGREGVLFTNFYASSFRTDRGLAAILSSFPAPPSTSLLKYVDKFEHLPSLPSLLRDEGYDAAYYYGGDANFTNMQAYLVSSGFARIVSDKDFPVRERTSKWGAHDEKVFACAFEEIKAASAGERGGTPRLSVVQTSSSHEPFEVPYSNPRFVSEPRKNAFAYADSCLTEFVDSLRTLPTWDRTLLVILPDHYGCWPENIASAPERHHIPLVLAGGALAVKGVTVDKLASQTDLSATLLAMMGISSSPLRYSRDIFSPATAPVAVFTEPSLIGIVTPGDTLVYNPDADVVIREDRDAGATSPLLPAAKAFLRNLYSALDAL